MQLLVLNMEVSGMNKYLFAQLKQKGWDLNVVDIPYPKWCRWQALLSTFTPNIKRWKKKFDAKINKLHKTAKVFQWRSKYCEKVLKRFEGQFDEILQIAGTFAPFNPQKILDTSININTNNYNLLISYTMQLSKGFEGWEPFEGEFDKWVQYETLLYKHAKQIFTTNENVRKSLINNYGIDENRVVKIGYGLTLNELPDGEKKYDGKTILFIGMDFERKGGFVLLEAFKKVKEQIKDARLVIVGPNKDLLKIDQPGVEMLGHVSERAKIDQLYKEASIFVMPSLMEPFGLVFLEAMAYKLPCIGTTVDAMPEIIDEGATGYLVSPGDVEILAERMASLLKDQARLKDMGTLAQQRVKNEFDWDLVGTRLDERLQEQAKYEKTH